MFERRNAYEEWISPNMGVIPKRIRLVPKCKKHFLKAGRTLEFLRMGKLLQLMGLVTVAVLTVYVLDQYRRNVLPYFSQYKLQVVLEPGGKPLGWDCLERTYGYEDMPDKHPNMRYSKMRRLSSTEYRVPNIVHFVTFGKNREFSFLNYLSILSAYRVQNPDIILFHHDYLPIGKWWEQCKKDVPILEMIHRTRPVKINNQRIDLVYHASDITRIEVLLAYGGIYLDFDVILIQSLDDLRQYPCTLGKEKPPKFIAGVIVAEKGCLFLKLWLEGYKHNYAKDLWDYNSGYVPYYIYERHPKLLHAEDWRLTTPDWTEREELLLDNIAWRDLYSLHMMSHEDDEYKFTPESIKTDPGIMGSVMRNLYYGSPVKILPKNSSFPLPSKGLNTPPSDKRQAASLA